MKQLKSVTVNGREWTPALVKEAILTSNNALQRAILRVYENQTADEQRVGATIVTNGKGFNKYDADIMTSFAKQIQQGRTLSEKQLAVARKKMQWYSKQVFNHIVAKAAQN